MTRLRVLTERNVLVEEHAARVEHRKTYTTGIILLIEDLGNNSGSRLRQVLPTWRSVGLVMDDPAYRRTHGVTSPSGVTA